MAGTGGYNSPNLPNLNTDPSSINTPGLQQEINNVYTEGGLAQGHATNAARAALQASGVAGGGESTHALGDIAGQTAQQESSGLSGLQNQQFQQQATLMDALNNANLQNYASQAMNNLGFNSQRNQMINGTGQSGSGLASMIGNIASQMSQNQNNSNNIVTGNDASLANNNGLSTGNIMQMIGPALSIAAMAA